MAMYDAGVVLVQADGDVRVALVVAQADVEGRPVALDEVGLQDERLALGARDHDLQPVDAVDHLPRLGMDAPARPERPRVVGAERRLEVREHPFAQRLGLADVEDVVRGVPVDVDAGAIGQGGELRADRWIGGHPTEYRSVSRIPDVPRPERPPERRRTDRRR